MNLVQVERFIPVEDRQMVSALSKAVFEGKQSHGWESESTSRTCEDDCGQDRGPSDLDSMKDRFAKLLLGEDMSGGGKGVSSALALSNAITNLAASVFGEQCRLEPMSAERKTTWRKEIDWLLSVTDYIVEFVPSLQTTKEGTTVEIMVTRQRKDLLVNIPALRKLDAMLIECLDNFRDQNEFWYVYLDEDIHDMDSAQQRQEDKWWLPKPKVPANGLSESSRKFLQFQKDSVIQVLKASMAINSLVLSEMKIPEAYTESLPKNAKTSLGDAIYKSITADVFDPELFLASMDLSTDYKIVDLKNRIEASMVIWQRKMHNKNGKSSWGSSVSLEKREQFEERAATTLLLLKHRFPGSSQSALDISKIQYNLDVGQSVIESYSRTLESLASTVANLIDEVLYADLLVRNTSDNQSNHLIFSQTGHVKKPSTLEEMFNLSSTEGSRNFLVQSDLVQFEPEESKEKISTQEFIIKKLPDIITSKRFSFAESLAGLRSPTSRH